MIFSRWMAGDRRSAPLLLWRASLILAILLILLPPSLLLPVKRIVQQAFAPGYYAGATVRDGIHWLSSKTQQHLATVDDLSLALAENKRLSARNCRLQAALLAAQAAQPNGNNTNGNDNATVLDRAVGIVQPSEPLLDWDVIEARVLGLRARAYLARLYMITGGEAAGFVPENLVIEGSEGPSSLNDLALPGALIDQGDNARLEIGQLTVAGRRVWGKLIEVGPQVSTVRRVNEAGYRDLVQLATHDGKRLRLGPRGIVHGTGERLCRIRLVKTIEPVEVGDLVFAAGGEGLIPPHLSYGKVARVERSPGDVHWQIWMEPALSPDMPEQIGVLRVQPNRHRVAVGDPPVRHKRREF